MTKQHFKPDSDDDEMKPLHRVIDIRLLAIWPIAALIHTVGNFTGHYQGFYAQSEPALYLQGLLIVMMVAASFVIVPALDNALENS
jgi:hypothetical protein